MIDIDALVSSPTTNKKYYKTKTPKPTILETTTELEPTIDKHLELIETVTDIQASKNIKPTKKPNTSKSKGNQFENKTAKLIGTWIFDDKDAFIRSITSGAIKSCFVGDIVPQKQLGWVSYPFLIECKNGYSNNIPNFINYSKIEEWLIKCLKERTKEQPIIYLICAFHSYGTILITDVEMALKSNLIVKVDYNNNKMPFFIYKLKDLLEYNFYSLYSHIPALLDVFNKE